MGPDEQLAIGAVAPGFSLPDTEGRIHSLGEPGEAPATVVHWTCNHCPYALAWHDRIAAAAADHDSVRFVAINSNNAERYPRDSPEAMAERWAAEEWPFPYLHDADQAVARAYGARTTPDIFILDADLKLAYRGAPDGDHQDPAQDAAWLREALSAVLAGSEPDTPLTEPVGCSIKWKE